MTDFKLEKDHPKSPKTRIIKFKKITPKIAPAIQKPSINNIIKIIAKNDNENMASFESLGTKRNLSN